MFDNGARKVDIFSTLLIVNPDFIMKWIVFMDGAHPQLRLPKSGR